MRIVYFNYMADLYGSSIGSTIKAQQLLGHLAERGHVVRFFWRYEGKTTSLPGDENQKQAFFRHPVLRRCLFTPKEIVKNILDLVREYRFINKHKPDIIISRVDAYRFSSSLLALLMGIPLILEADGANSYEWLRFNNRDGIIWKSWLLFIEKLNFRFAGHVFVQSTVTRLYYERLYGCYAKKSVITNAATLKSSNKRTAIRAELGMDDAKVVCGFLGSLHYWHGTNVLKELIARIMNDDENVWFLIIGGGGPNAGAFRAFCERQPWHRRIVFVRHKNHDQVHHYVDLFDIALAPYTDETLFYYSPVKVFEYMAMAKAVLTVPVGQLKEIIEHGQNGYFFNPGSLYDLESKLKELILDKKLRQRVGQNARRTIEQRHTWHHKAAQLEAICTNLLKQENEQDHFIE